jgi:hypothetical protein
MKQFRSHQTANSFTKKRRCGPLQRLQQGLQQH